MYGLFGLLPTSAENFMSTAPLEIYLLRKMVMCSILILPAVAKNIIFAVYVWVYTLWFTGGLVVCDDTG